METNLVEVFRREAAHPNYTEIKDPSVVALPDGSYLMFASIGSSITQKWQIGRFTAQHPSGPWHEQEPAAVNSVDGPEVCAPAVQLRQGEDGRHFFEMYVQTSCFQENGIIALATSEDGQDFNREMKWSLTKDDINDASIPSVGLYDAGISDITHGGKNYECLTFSAYRRVGCGDLYLSMREIGGENLNWSPPQLVMKQEDIPFHNHPDSPNFEWGLEGAKIVQLAEDKFMMIGVCFLEKEHVHLGTRQRVFLALADSPFGPFNTASTPLDPTNYPEGCGENGHPDTIDLGDRLGILYQERAGDRKPWHLRYAEADKADLMRIASRPVPQYLHLQAA